LSVHHEENRSRHRTPGALSKRGQPYRGKRARSTFSPGGEL
jgi:hypothetical protein